MVHKIEFNNRNSVIDCFLPKDSVPDKNAVAELYQMTALEETLDRLAALPGFFRENEQRIEKTSVSLWKSSISLRPLTRPAVI